MCFLRQENELSNCDSIQPKKTKGRNAAGGAIISPTKIDAICVNIERGREWSSQMARLFNLRSLTVN